MQFERKEVVLLVATTLLAFVSIIGANPCVFAICFAASGVCFIYLCWSHKGARVIARITWTVIILLVYTFVGELGYESAIKTASAVAFIPSDRPKFTEKFDRVTFEVGGSRAILPNKDGMRIALLKVLPSGVAFTAIGGDYSHTSPETPLIASIADGRMYIDAEVSSSIGRLPVHVRNNFVYDRPSDWDVNTDQRSAIEVVNERRMPMLQIISSGEARITVKGVFINGDMVVVADRKIVAQTGVNPTRHPIRRLFKYPSSDYYGTFDYSLLRCLDQFRIW